MRILPFLLATILACSLNAQPAGAVEEDQQTDDQVQELGPAYLPPSDVGRYALFDGQLTVGTLKGPDVPERHLFKIDSVTGQTWVGKQTQYLDKRGRVVQHRYWEPFEQYIEALPSSAVQGR